MLELAKAELAQSKSNSSRLQAYLDEKTAVANELGQRVSEYESHVETKNIQIQALQDALDQSKTSIDNIKNEYDSALEMEVNRGI